MEVDEKPPEMQKCIKMEVVEDSNNEENKAADLPAQPGPSNGSSEQEDKAEAKKVEPDKIESTVKLSVDGVKENDDEKTVVLSPEEVKTFLLKKVTEYMSSPKNPLTVLQNRSKELESEGNILKEEYTRLYKALQGLEKNQEKFLRHIGILPKMPMCDVSVSANLPPETLPKTIPVNDIRVSENMSAGTIPKPETLVKKELSITKVDKPAQNNTPNFVSKSKLPSADIECIDLTDVDDPVPTTSTANQNKTPPSLIKHPAPLPLRPYTKNFQLAPSKPRLKISAEERGIILTWDMSTPHTAISSFDIFGYQEQRNVPINTLLWKKIGSVKAMNLPMACTLTQFVNGNKYHFSIRAVDAEGRCGQYSDAISIVYNQKKPTK